MRQRRSAARMTHHEDRLVHPDFSKIGKEQPVQREADRVERRNDWNCDEQNRQVVATRLRNLLVPGEADHLEVVVEVKVEEHFDLSRIQTFGSQFS